MITNNSKILIIYTGGTIGMIVDPDTNTLKPFDFDHFSKQIPEIKRFDFIIDSYSFENPIDSSDMNPLIWNEIGDIIFNNYHQYDGFVVLHGSDTMSYSSSALSFMFENLSKPIIFTGSQLPIGVIRTDGKENLITALEIAASKINQQSIINEVAVYFEYSLLRANRSTKHNAAHFDAFHSFNYPKLAEAGVKINYNKKHLLENNNNELIYRKIQSKNILNIKLYPGIQFSLYKNTIINNKIQGVILESYGSGNASSSQSLKQFLEYCNEKNIIVLNITQCNEGNVEQGTYEASSIFVKYGVVNGYDLTFEAAITKMQYLLSNYSDYQQIKNLLTTSLRGEITN